LDILIETGREGYETLLQVPSSPIQEPNKSRDSRDDFGESLILDIKLGFETNCMAQLKEAIRMTKIDPIEYRALGKPRNT
jgi:hypothetical protein